MDTCTPLGILAEIGYLAYLEPLVRDLPLSCGAGKAQCVVLPDGAVVSSHVDNMSTGVHSITVFDGIATITVSIAAGREYTRVELLNAIYEQRRRSLLLSMRYDWLSPKAVFLWNRDLSFVAAIHQNGALLWSAIREIFESDSTLPSTIRLIILTSSVSATSSPVDMDLMEVQQ